MKPKNPWEKEVTKEVLEKHKESLRELFDSDDDPDGENVIEKMTEALQKPKKHGVH